MREALALTGTALSRPFSDRAQDMTLSLLAKARARRIEALKGLQQSRNSYGCKVVWLEINRQRRQLAETCMFISRRKGAKSPHIRSITNAA